MYQRFDQVSVLRDTLPRRWRPPDDRPTIPQSPRAAARTRRDVGVVADTPVPLALPVEHDVLPGHAGSTDRALVARVFDHGQRTRARDRQSDGRALHAEPGAGGRRCGGPLRAAGPGRGRAGNGRDRRGGRARSAVQRKARVLAHPGPGDGGRGGLSVRHAGTQRDRRERGGTAAAHERDGAQL